MKVNVIIQHCKAVQPHTANSLLAKSPLKSQTAHKACQWAWEKHPAKADHSNLIVKFDSVFMKLCVCEEKSNLQSWVKRMVFVDPVTFFLFLRI